MDAYFILKNLESSLRDAVNRTERAFFSEVSNFGV